MPRDWLAGAVILPLLAVVLAGFPLLAVAAWVIGGRVGACGTAGLAAASGGLALAAIIGGSVAVLPVPFGLVLAVDPLAAFFILPVCIAAMAGCARGAGGQGLTPVLVGALLLTLLAGDGLALVLGFVLAMLACWGMLGIRRAAATGAVVLGATCLVAAVALLSSGADVGFAAMRAAPPDGWRAGLVLVLVVVGAGSGLMQVQRAPSLHPAAAVVAAGMLAAGVYVLVRVLFDLAGPVTPQWWCAPVLLLGAGFVAWGGMRANQAVTLGGVLTGAATVQAGFAVVGVGVALAARAADLAPLQSWALAGAMLHVLNVSVFQTLAFVGVEAAERGAGSGRLDRLGGLMHQMPVTGACVLVAAASLAVLPPSAGFASVWMVFEGVIAAPRVGGLAVQCLLAAVVAVMALGTALMASAMLRMVGVAFLGRPRTPRAAAAEEAPLPTRCVLIVLASLAGWLGVLPAAALHLLPSGPPWDIAAGGWLAIPAPGDGPGYLPWALLGLGGAVLGALVLLGRRLRVGRPLVAAPWGYGFAPPPAWLPFGDPATQYTAASLALPPLPGLGGAWRRLAVMRRVVSRAAVWCEGAGDLIGMAVLLAAGLLLLAWWAAA